MFLKGCFVYVRCSEFIYFWDGTFAALRNVVRAFLPPWRPTARALGLAAPCKIIVLRSCVARRC